MSTDNGDEIPLDRLVRVFKQMRTTLAEHNRQAKLKAATLKQQMRMVENELLRRAHVAGLTGFKTKDGTTYIGEDWKVSFADRDTFVRFLETDEDPFGWFNGVSVERLRAYMKTVPEEEGFPPGLNVFREERMKVRSTRSKAVHNNGDMDDDTSDD